jgi:hypothetical protein
VAMGLRQGECFGLTVDRVDFLRRHVRVDRQLISALGGVPAFGPPKSKAGFRTVPMPGTGPSWTSIGASRRCPVEGEAVGRSAAERLQMRRAARRSRRRLLRRGLRRRGPRAADHVG